MNHPDQKTKPILYLAPTRFPSEKANGVQIINTCHALAEAGVPVTLIAPKRYQTNPELKQTIWDYYQLTPNFEFNSILTLNLQRYKSLPHPLGHLAYLTESSFFALNCLIKYRHLSCCKQKDRKVGTDHTV